MRGRIISAHEHLGYARLTFSNGTYAEYDAELEKLIKELSDLKNYFGSEKVECIVYPQIPYKQYSVLKEYERSSSEMINREFFNMLERVSDVVWYPFIYLRVTDSYEINERIINKYADRAYGIKLHPDADFASAEVVLQSGILNLAEKYQKPITMHCSRPGRGLDLKEISDKLMDKISCCDIRINLAHIGFLHKYIFEVKLPSNIYFDLSPIGIIEDNLNYMDDKFETFKDQMMDILVKYGNRLMYGGDYPYNIQKWEDGSIHGRSRMKDLAVIMQLLDKTGMKAEDIFFNNICNFLQIKKKK